MSEDAPVRGLYYYLHFADDFMVIALVEMDRWLLYGQQSQKDVEL